MTIEFARAGGGGGEGGGGAQATHSGAVASGDAAVVAYVELDDGQSLSVADATFVQAGGSAVPTDCDLVFATPGTGSYGPVLAGDGATVYVQESGEPLASLENTWAETRLVALAVDNGNWNAGTGAAQEIVAAARFEVS